MGQCAGDGGSEGCSLWCPCLPIGFCSAPHSALHPPGHQALLCSAPQPGHGTWRPPACAPTPHPARSQDVVLGPLRPACAIRIRAAAAHCRSTPHIRAVVAHCRSSQNLLPSHRLGANHCHRLGALGTWCRGRLGRMRGERAHSAGVGLGRGGKGYRAVDRRDQETAEQHAVGRRREAQVTAAPNPRKRPVTLLVNKCQ